MSGRRLTAKREKPTPPKAMIATISIATVTRRRVENSTSFTGLYPYLRPYPYLHP